MNWQLRRELLTNVAAIMGGGLTAALNLDFTALTPATMATAGVTFSRASLATQYDSTGKLTFAPNNLVANSATMGTTSHSTLTTGQSDPFGGTNATKMVEDATTNEHLVNSAASAGLTIGAKYVSSVYVKAGARTRCRFYFYGFNDYIVFLNLSTGATDNPTGGTSPTLTVTDAGSGWWRVSLCDTLTANPELLVYLIASGTTTNYAGDGVSDMYIAGRQVEAVTYVTTPGTYTATSGGFYYGPRFDYNPSTLAAKGLLIEEARTNTFTRSDNFGHADWGKYLATVTDNTQTSPDGTVNADTFTANAGGSDTRLVYQGQSFTNATRYTFSVYAKKGTVNFIQLTFGTTAFASSYANFDLNSGVVGTDGGAGVTKSIQDVGNGWYRCVMSQTATSTNSDNGHFAIATSASDVRFFAWTPAGTETIYAYGAQLEPGAFSSSYISTTSASATRAKDFANITGSNFSSWYNATSGTFIINAARNHSTNGSGVIAASNGSFNEAIYSTMTFDHRSEVSVRTGSSTVADLLSGNTTSEGSFFKLAYAYASNDFASSLNGGTVVTDASGGLPTVDRLNIGGDAAVWNDWIGWYKSLTYYASRLPNATLQSLTT